MQRKVTEGKKGDVVKLSPHKAYVVAGALSNASIFGAAGLTATRNIDEEDGLYVLGIIQAVGATLALIVLIHETVEAIKDWRNFSISHSLYLFYTLSFIVMGFVAAALFINAAATKDTESPKSTIAVSLSTLGMFVSGALRGPNKKARNMQGPKIVEVADSTATNDAATDDESEDEEKGTRMTTMKKSK